MGSSGRRRRPAVRPLAGIGDDCAVIRQDPPGDKVWLLTTDALVEAVHFDRAWHSPRLLGRKAAAVNISDIAAMGGRPLFALLSVALPAGLPDAWFDDFLAGFNAVLREHGMLLVGGDTVRSGSAAMFNVTVIGEAEAGLVLYRAGARDGDTVWVSGSLGLAAAGLELCRRGVATDAAEWAELLKAHLDPEVQVAMGRVLAASGLVHAMLDISDGLATDLAHLCTESGVGAEVVAEQLPGTEKLAMAAAFCNMSGLDWMLSGGEDYQLLFTTPVAAAAILPQLVLAQTGRQIHAIGRIRSRHGVVLCSRDQDGGEQRREISYQGFDHFV